MNEPMKATQNGDAEFEAIMRDLRAEFLCQLPTFVARLEALESPLHQPVAADLRQLHNMAHTLAGLGATFGHPRISEAAEQVERISKFVPRQSAEQTALQTAVQALLAALRAPITSA